MQNRTFYYSPEALGYVERMPATDTMPEHEQVHDMLKRNAHAFFCYNTVPGLSGDLIISIARCFNKSTIKRHPKHDGKDTSRDQVISAVAVFQALGNTDISKELAGFVKFRISKRYFCTPSLWFWLKFIQHNKAMYKWLFLLFFYIENFFIGAIIAAIAGMFIGLWALPLVLFSPIPYTLVILKLYGVKATHHDELKYQTVIVQKMSDMVWLKRTLLRTTFPSFALFLAAQMFWALDIKSPIMAAYTRRVDLSNYVCRKMFGEDVKHHSPPPPLNDIRWECEFSEREPRYFYRVEPENNLAIDFYNRLFS